MTDLEEEVELLTAENDMLEQDIVNIRKECDELISVLRRVKKSIVDQKLKDRFGHTLSYVDEQLDKY